MLPVWSRGKTIWVSEDLLATMRPFAMVDVSLHLHRNIAAGQCTSTHNALTVRAFGDCIHIVSINDEHALHVLQHEK